MNKAYRLVMPTTIAYFAFVLMISPADGTEAAKLGAASPGDAWTAAIQLVEDQKQAGNHDKAKRLYRELLMTVIKSGNHGGRLVYCLENLSELGDNRALSTLQLVKKANTTFPDCPHCGLDET